ncbi:MAG: class I SAM-dependent methyltransferase [Proteobacteria bacterium]|nr:class I SAM-dependent methyltransferase [Pseudomonadota bacterium]
MDIRGHNRTAWNSLVDQGDRWTVAVSSETIARARRGDWNVVLTPQKPVPRGWFPPLSGAEVLGLASAGGQQGPILAAAGARVLIADNSPEQLAQDRAVADRDDLDLQCVEVDMADLDMLEDSRFDLVFHPVSNCFVPDVLPVWREAFRVLRPGGVLLAGFCNPVRFMFDRESSERGALVVRYKLPYSDLTSLEPGERERLIGANEPLEFGHTLEAQIGGQLAAGFLLTALYEDDWSTDDSEALSRYMQSFIATRAVKPV